MNIVLQMARHEGYDVHSIEGVTAFKPADKRPEVVRFLARELDKVAIWLTGKPADEQPRQRRDSPQEPPCPRKCAA
jgi:hypothetical protein